MVVCGAFNCPRHPKAVRFRMSVPVAVTEGVTQHLTGATVATNSRTLVSTGGVGFDGT